MREGSHFETPPLALRSRRGHWCVLARGPSVPHPLLQEPRQSQWVAAMILRMFHPKSTAQSLGNASGRGSICRMLRRVPTGSGHRGHRACAGSVASCRSQTATGHGYFLQSTATMTTRTMMMTTVTLARCPAGTAARCDLNFFAQAQRSSSIETQMEAAG